MPYLPNETVGSNVSAEGVRAHRFIFAGIIVCFVALVYVLWLLYPPAAFPVGKRIEIPSGTSVTETVRALRDSRVVRSDVVLQVILLSQFRASNVQAGTYQFDEPLSAFAVARAITMGTHGIPLVRITIPEGLRNEQIDAIVNANLPNIPKDAFLKASEGKEGFLFPETYHVPEQFEASDLVQLMTATHTEAIDSLQGVIIASGQTEEDIVIMASILEREANSIETMRIVSGILWKRLELGMPLQVDASFAYLLNKKSEEITRDDLLIDSPYNTYKYRGLPPTPISNPGRVALEAAASPISTPYLYYITAPDGTFYYAETFEGHKKNIERHL